MEARLRARTRRDPFEPRVHFGGVARQRLANATAEVERAEENDVRDREAIGNDEAPRTEELVEPVQVVDRRLLEAGGGLGQAAQTVLEELQSLGEPETVVEV